MTYEEFKSHTENAIRTISNIEYSADLELSTDDDHYGKLVLNGRNYLLKIQNESEKFEKGEEKFILSLNFLVRIKAISLDVNEQRIYKSLNSFNEKYSVIKAIYNKKDSKGHSFWFRNEQLLAEPLDPKIIKNILSYLEASPRSLSLIVKG
ncbi:hypothetical protein PEC301877_05310 [Pectobacterium carotovorum subsp. carotovorum]|nr:hypothetical protein PEC301877_05310 [Pectobacterium carotovorum subsp. carotovorum]